MPSTTLSSLLVALCATSIVTYVNGQTTTTPVTGTLGNATVVENNPPNTIVVAKLGAQSFFNPSDPRGNIKGSVSASSNPDGIGVSFVVTFSNLPTSGGPFLYHIHSTPVPTDGNCTGTLGHLDPFIRGEKPPCDPTLPQTCQVGDLSGKYGKITSDPFTASYEDEFASLENGLGSYFGNRSLTIHFGNATRITCANFTAVGNTVGGINSTSTGPIQFTGSATSLSTTSAALNFFAFATLLMLLC